MLVATLDAKGIITGMEVISDRGMEQGYRPDGKWVEAQAGWRVGGVIDEDDGYTAPAAVEAPTSAPDRVTSRQFKMQLEIDGLTDAVESWVAQQSKLVQIGYNESGTFVRDDPMLVAGFKALKFTIKRVDEFFVAAAEL